MAETALAALQRAVGDALAADPTVSGLVEARIYADQAPAKVARPYIVFFWVGGGQIYLTRAGHHELMLIVKGVAADQATAFALAAAIDGVLTDADISDPAKALDGGADWQILHEIGGLLVHLVETVDGLQIYHEGKRHTFLMEAT